MSKVILNVYAWMHKNVEPKDQLAWTLEMKKRHYSLKLHHMALWPDFDEEILIDALNKVKQKK